MISSVVQTYASQITDFFLKKPILFFLLELVRICVLTHNFIGLEKRTNKKGLVIKTQKLGPIALFL